MVLGYLQIESRLNNRVYVKYHTFNVYLVPSCSTTSTGVKTAAVPQAPNSHNLVSVI